MGKFAEIMRAVMAAISSMAGGLVRKTKAGVRWVGGRAVTVLEDSWEWVRETAVPAVAHGTWEGIKAAPGLAVAGTVGGLKLAGSAAVGTTKVAGAAVNEVALAPFRALGALKRAVFGGGGGGAGGAQAEQSAVDQAAQAEELRQAQAARVTEMKETLSAFRRSVAAMAAGREPADQDIGRLPQPLLDLLGKLTPDECDVLSKQSLGVLQAYNNGQGAVPGVRSLSDVNRGATPAPSFRTATPEQLAAEARFAERSELREAIRRSRRSALSHDNTELAA